MSDPTPAGRAGAPAAGAPPLQDLAARAAALGGWRRLALAAGLGAVSAAALPPVYLVPLLVPAFVALAWMLDGTATRWGAFWLGWAFGLGQFAAGLYWIGIAFFVDAEKHAWMMPIAVLGLSAGLAIFPGLAALAARMLPVGWAARAGAAWPRLLALAAAWCALEWLRGAILTGFPWNLMGSVWSFHPAPQQAAALAGAWGLSLITVLAASLPAALGWASGRAAWAPVLAAVALVAALLGGGALRLAAAPAPGAETVDGVALRLVQPDIPQHLKWRNDLRRQHVTTQVRLSRSAGFDSRSHVIWPETAVPFFLPRQGGPELRAELASAAPEGGALITGAPRITQRAEGGRRLHNGLIALGPDGRTLASFDKFHLVPFGEYVPLRDWLPVDKITPGRVDFSPGPGPRNLEVPGVPAFSPLICYEAIFPREVVRPGTRPGWLLNVTNDAWFGRSSGPYQHLASARLRAVEQGLPLVRAANTGISVIVDPWGRTLRRLGLGESGVLDGPLPRALAQPTPYARIGDWGFAALLAAVAAAAAIGGRSGAGSRRPEASSR
jgi:apolipoprotein N-acyltransferase